jgi:adenylosuccinate lyase
MLGRTHGQAAEKISLSNKFASYKAILSYLAPKERYFGRLAGSVGDYKYFSREVEERALTELGLEVCPFNDGQVINRAVYARYMNNWATLASAIGKIATDIRLLAQSDVGEMQESFSHDQIGSSSMPQKQNPILCENLCGLARVIRGYQTTTMQDIELWNERDISHSSAERMVFPDASVLLGFMLTRMADVLEKLYVNKDRMNINLGLFEEKISAQEKMLGLIKNGSSRKDAHKTVKEMMLK